MRLNPPNARWFRCPAVLIVLTLAGGGLSEAALVTDLSGSVLWLDAAQIPPQANDTDLTTWADQSAAGTNDVSQATASKKPHYIDAANGLNGRPLVRFNGGQALFSGSVTSFNDFSAFAVYQFDALGSDRIVVSKYDYPTSNREWAFFYNANNLRMRTSDDGSATSDLTFGNPPTGSFNVETLSKSGAAATLFRNGSPLSGSGSVRNPLHAGNSHFGIGGVNATAAGPVSTLDGDIAEIVVYDRPVSAAERIVMENYLSAKYNVGVPLAGSDNALAANDFYAGDTTANGNYDLDVIGLGQASGTTLSGSSGSGLALSAGASLDTDGEFVLAGHNVATNALTGADLGGLGNVDLRWERVWYLDTTGGVDVAVDFDYPQSGLAAPDAADVLTFSLLYSPTNAFNFSVLDPGGIYDGNQVAFALADGFADGYYTLGIQEVPEPGAVVLLLFGGLLAAPLLRRRRRR
jgi:hypothetical protein